MNYDEKIVSEVTKFRRRDALKTALIAATGATFAMPTIVSAQPATVKLGAVGSVTGAIAYTGTQARHGIQFAVDQINKAGGIKSLNGAKVEIVFVDAQSRPDIGAAEVDKLAQAGVACIVGAQSSAISLSTSQAAARHGRDPGRGADDHDEDASQGPADHDAGSGSSTGARRTGGHGGYGSGADWWGSC